MSLKKILIGSDIAIRCDTFEKAKQLFKILDSWEVVWCNYNSLYYYKDLNWEYYEDKTCYEFDDYDGKLRYSEIEFYKKEDYEIWTFEQFMDEYNKDGIGEENKLIHTINLGNKCRIIESDDMTLTIEVTEKIGTFILKNMEEEIMKTIEAKIATRDNKQILTFLTKGLEQEDFNISSFKKYEDEHTLQLRITTKKGNQYLDEGHEEIIKIDRIFMPKKIKFKCNNGVMSTEFDCIDKSIEVEME